MAMVESPDGPEPLSGWWRRVGAQIIDSGLIIAAALALAFGLGAKRGGVGALVGLLVFWFGGLPYYTLCHGSRRGKTLGKLVSGIAVRADPERVGRRQGAGYGRALGRALMFMLFGFVPLLGPLNALWPLWDYKSQAWHDKVAGTVVVRTRWR
jgi:uncharacterized RDD family membrane protein YckC